MTVTPQQVAKLREITSAGILDCKKALEASQGDFDKAIQLGPQDASAYQYRATIYLLMGDYNRAGADYSAVILLKPDYRLAYENRAITYEAMGDKQKAKADWDKVAEIVKQKANH